MDPEAIKAFITQQVTEAMANYNANQNEGSGQGTENFNGGRSEVPRLCSYEDFVMYKPKSFSGSGGIIELTRWLGKIESVFTASFCADDCKVRFAARTFKDPALSWWYGNVKTMGVEATNAMTWEELKDMMIKEYCPRSLAQNLEQEFENLTMQGSEITTYTNRFSDLAILCSGRVVHEYKKIERYVWGLAPQVQTLVAAHEPTTFKGATVIAAQITDQCIHLGTMAPRADLRQKGNNKRKFQGTSKQSTVDTHATTTAETPTLPEQYAGSLPNCNKCNFHHTGACRVMYCSNHKRQGHTTRFCKGSARKQNHGKSARVSRACLECGELGHLKRNCPKARGSWKK